MHVSAQAKALGIDLFPRPTGSTEDVPIYDQRQQGGASSSQQQQPQQGYGYPPQQQQGQYPTQQQYGLPQQGYGQQGPGGYMRPGSARPAPSGQHPFDLPPQNQNYNPNQAPQVRQPVYVSAE